MIISAWVDAKHHLGLRVAGVAIYILIVSLSAESSHMKTFYQQGKKRIAFVIYCTICLP